MEALAHDDSIVENERNEPVSHGNEESRECLFVAFVSIYFDLAI